MADNIAGINKVDVFGIGISVVSPKQAVDAIVEAAIERRSFGYRPCVVPRQIRLTLVEM